MVRCLAILTMATIISLSSCKRQPSTAQDQRQSQVKGAGTAVRKSLESLIKLMTTKSAKTVKEAVSETQFTVSRATNMAGIGGQALSSRMFWGCRQHTEILTKPAQSVT